VAPQSLEREPDHGQKDESHDDRRDEERSSRVSFPDARRQLASAHAPSIVLRKAVWSARFECRRASRLPNQARELLAYTEALQLDLRQARSRVL
jgi:hypothetical protein